MKNKKGFFKNIHENFKQNNWKVYWITFIPFFIASLIMVIIADNGSGCGCDLETIASIVAYVGLLFAFVPYLYYKFAFKTKIKTNKKDKDKKNENKENDNIDISNLDLDKL